MDPRDPNIVPASSTPDEAADVAYLDVSPGKDWGDDGEGPKTDQAVWDWLVVADDPHWSVAERIGYAETIGRDDIVEALLTLSGQAGTASESKL